MTKIRYRWLRLLREEVASVGFSVFAKPFGITGRVRKCVQFGIFYAILFQMTPLLLQRESLWLQKLWNEN